MGNTDSIPIVSQVKSLVQVVSGDAEGAKKTQQNFANTAVGVSQAKSLVQAIGGDEEGAAQTQRKFVKSIEDVADNTPVVGHIKGAVHYAIGETERGDEILKSSTGSLVTAAAGVGGFLVGGPAAGAAAAVTASQAYDGLITAIQTALDEDDDGSPDYYGSWQTFNNIVRGKATPGEIFDTAAGIGFDALGGATAAKVGSGKKVPARGGNINRKSPSRTRLVCRDKRNAESYLTIKEMEFATGHQRLPESFGDVLKKDWQNMGVNNTVSSLVSLFIILRLILWNDNIGRSYSSEVCSMTSSGYDEIATCQLALTNTLRKMENRLNSDNGKDMSYILYPNITLTPKVSSNASVEMIKIMTTLYGILSNMATGREMGIIWIDELCLYEDLTHFRICEKQVQSKLMDLGSKALLLGEHRKLRIKRGTCKPDVTQGRHGDVTRSNRRKNKGIKKKQSNKRKKTADELQSNHLPAKSTLSKTYPNINFNDLIAHRLSYDVHGIAMQHVGTTGSGKIPIKLRKVEEYFISRGELAKALKVDLIASYGRANVKHAKGKYASALIEYADELRKVIGHWKKGVRYGNQVIKISNAEAKSLHKFLDDEIKVYSNYPSIQGSLTAADWKNWFERLENKYEEIVDKQTSLTTDDLNVAKKDRIYG